MEARARTARTAALIAVILLVPAAALGQEASAQGPAGTPPAPPPPATAPPATSGSTASTPPASTGPLTGYGWGGDSRPAPAPVHRYYAPAGPTALPGFEPMPDGSSRFYVQLTKGVAVTEQRANGTITYVLKGAHVAVYNNYRPLVTVHFNTPVWRARLVPHGADLHFVLEMRASVAPTFKVDTSPSGMATLQVDFPGGQFLASDMPELPPPSAVAAPASSH